jgi:hypothetical protein
MGSREIHSLFPVYVAFSIDLVFSLFYASLEFATTYLIDFHCFCHTLASATWHTPFPWTLMTLSMIYDLGLWSLPIESSMSAHGK